MNGVEVTTSSRVPVTLPGGRGRDAQPKPGSALGCVGRFVVQRSDFDGRYNLRCLRDRGRPVPSRRPSSPLGVFRGDTGKLFFGRKLTPVSSSNSGLDFPLLPLLNLQVIADGLVHDIVNRSGSPLD